MIRFLSIRDLAVIDRLELDLNRGFTVLTGETGTGKSIVVGALSLLRGGRAAADLVRTGATKAVIEAAAELPDGEVGTRALLHDERIAIKPTHRVRTRIHIAIKPLA